MSRREGRDSDSKRHRSRFDRESSPKRSRRDGKPETERVSGNSGFDIRDPADRNQKHRRRLQDALPLEAPQAPDAKVDNGSTRKESDKKPEHEEAKQSSDPTEAPRSRSFFQHDERSNAGQVGRSSGRRAATERGWWKDSKDHHNERKANTTSAHYQHKRDEKAQDKGADRSVWRHDGFFEMESDPPPPPPRKRTFTEKKISLDSGNVEKSTVEPAKPRHSDQPPAGGERREDKVRNPRNLDRPDRPSAGDSVPDRRELRRSTFPVRDRYGGGDGGNHRGRERFNGRQGYRSHGTRVEKWKHDLFVEANTSPPRKSEDDQIAKVEALLAS